MALNQDIRFVVSLLDQHPECSRLARDVMKQFLLSRVEGSQGRLMLVEQLIDSLFDRYHARHWTPTHLGYELQSRLSDMMTRRAANCDLPAEIHRLHG